MGEFSIWHWMVVLLVVLLLFGGGKVSGLMGDLAKGIKSFKQNMADDPPATPAKPVAGLATEAAPPIAAQEAAAHQAAAEQREPTAVH